MGGQHSCDKHKMNVAYFMVKHIRVQVTYHDDRLCASIVYPVVYDERAIVWALEIFKNKFNLKKEHLTSLSQETYDLHHQTQSNKENRPNPSLCSIGNAHFWWRQIGKCARVM